MWFFAAGELTIQTARADGDAIHVLGYVRDHAGNPLAGIEVIGDDYVGSIQTAITDEDGHYEIEVEPEVNVRVQPNCDQLAALGWICPPPETVTPSADDIEVDFVIHPAVADLLEVSTGKLSAAHEGVPYAAQLSATGGIPPYVWRLKLGSAGLPVGLVMTSDGSISGIPSTSGTVTLDVQVTDSVSTVTNRLVDLMVYPRPTISGLSWSNNFFSLRVAGVANHNYHIQMSTNCSADSWTTIATTNHPVAESFLVSDPQATDPARFYRVLFTPQIE